MPIKTGRLAYRKVYLTINKTRAKFYELAQAQNGNYKVAIALTGDWLKGEQGIATVVNEDSLNLLITLQSGLKTYYCISETNAQGKPIYRGGGGGNAFKRSALNGDCANKIENKKVLIFAAAYSEFYLGDDQKMQRVIDLFKDADSEFEVTLLKNTQCTPEVVATFGDYGFVSIETHGIPESFQSGIKLKIDDPAAIRSATDFLNYVKAKLGNKYVQWFNNGELEIGTRDYIDPTNPAWWQNAGNNLMFDYNISVTSLFLQSLPDMPNTIILGNMCFSGYGVVNSCRVESEPAYDHPIRLGFESLNPISYYYYAYNNGVSAPVLDNEAKEMLWQLTQSLLNDGDSTGNAHLTDAGDLREATVRERARALCGPFTFKQYGKPDYCYGGCGDTIIDSRDGKVYKTVCIGDQVWMAENLNWAGAGVCFDGNAANCDTYGRLYTITEVTNLDTSSTKPSGIKGICPQGWHVPSEAEFEELFAFCGGITEAAIKLRSTTTWATPNNYTDAFGFNFKASGSFRSNSDGTNSDYGGLGTAAYLWTSTMYVSGGTYFALNGFQPSLYMGNYSPPADMIWKFSCRCVKD